MGNRHRKNDTKQGGNEKDGEKGESGQPQKPEKEVIAKPVRHHGDSGVPDYRHSKRENRRAEEAAKAAEQRRFQDEARAKFLRARELEVAADLQALTNLARNGKEGTFAVRGADGFLQVRVYRNKEGRLVALPLKVGENHVAAETVRGMMKKNISLQLRFVFKGVKFLPPFLQPFEAGLKAVAEQFRKELERHGLAEAFKQMVNPKLATVVPKGDVLAAVQKAAVPASIVVTGSQTIN